VLSEALQVVRLSGALFFVTEVATPWVSGVPTGDALAPVVVPRSQHVVSYHLVSEGACWCSVPGERPLRLEQGDVLVVPHGDRYQLSTAPELLSETSDEETLRWFREAMRGGVPAVFREGGPGAVELQVLCGFLGCDAFPFNPILTELPRMLRIHPTGEAGARLSQLVRFAIGEAQRHGPGSGCVLLRLGELLFVEMLRVHLGSGDSVRRGWLTSLRDPTVGRALVLLHRDPAHDWSLDELSRKAGRSRSVLSERFTELLGEPPMQYLLRWRMQLAARLLSEGDAKVATVATEVGYQSEAAFCRAFKKVVGVAPTSWRHGERQTS